MTTAFFAFGNEFTVGFSISGHSGFGQSGTDIVCAAISSSATLTANLLSLFDQKVNITRREGFLSVFLERPNGTTEKVMKAFRFQLKDISNQYPDNLRVCGLNFKGGTHND